MPINDPYAEALARQAEFKKMMEQLSAVVKEAVKEAFEERDNIEAPRRGRPPKMQPEDM